MKRITALVAGLLISGATMAADVGWRTDFNKAKEEAKKENKLILLKFSGSDWCVPCIKMEKEIFAQDTFQNFALRNLVMVNADFPRQRQKPITRETRMQNDALAEQYDKKGHFPYTVLLNADGKVLMAWDGYKGGKPEDIIRDIKNYRRAD